MPPTRESTVEPKARPFRFLTRAELGRVWATELRHAREEGELRSCRGAAAWLARPLVRELLREFKSRALDVQHEREMFDSLCAAIFSA